jgi:hypothetical protein
MNLKDDKRKWRRHGRLSGYPECCIEYYVQLQLEHLCGTDGPLLPLPAGRLIGADKPDWVATKGEIMEHGFIPCPYHWEHPPPGYCRVSNRVINDE